MVVSGVEVGRWGLLQLEVEKPGDKITIKA